MSEAATKRTGSVAGTERLGAALAPALAVGDVVGLTGALGAGKTRFVAGLVGALVPGARVRSPSFTLVNEFPGPCPVFHLDLYRLESARAIEGLGLEELSARGALVVEWAERLPGTWLADALLVTITPGAGDARAISAAARGPRGGVLLAAWRALPEAW